MKEKAKGAVAPPRLVRLVGFRITACLDSIERLREANLGADIGGVFEVALHEKMDIKKVNGILRVGDDLESVLRGVGVVAVPGTKAPVGGMIFCHGHRHGSGRSNLLREKLPNSELNHDSLSDGVIKDHVLLTFLEWMWSALLHGVLFNFQPNSELSQRTVE